jgi:hypothetical protein
MVNSAAVEVKHAQVTGQKGSNFLDKQEELPPGSLAYASTGWWGDDPIATGRKARR